jgi:hypothetical protein
LLSSRAEFNPTDVDAGRGRRPRGISEAQYVALWVLCLGDDPSAGLAERLPNPADRRGVLVRATPAGRKVFARITPKLREYHHAQWANLTRRERQCPLDATGRSVTTRSSTTLRSSRTLNGLVR